MELDAVADFKGVPVGGIFVLPCFDKPEQVEREIYGKAQGWIHKLQKKTMREMSRPRWDDEKDAEHKDDGPVDATDEGNGKIHAVA